MTNSTHQVSTTISYAQYPKLRAFVEWGIDMQLADIRDMLRLPLRECGLNAGHNFAAATSLANLIAGASVWFYEASVPGCETAAIGRAATAGSWIATGRGRTARSSTPERATTCSTGMSATRSLTRSRSPIPRTAR